MAKKTKHKEKPALAGDYDSPQFWKGPALDIVGEKADEWELMEVATILHGGFVLLRDNYKQINTIANKQGGIGMSIGVKTDREVSPPTIAVNLGCNESHKWKFKSDCPDPNAKDLPGLSREELQAKQPSEPDPGEQQQPEFDKE
jgi:hypothetical protein